MNLVEALKSGGSGIVLLIMYYVLNYYVFILDNKVMKNDGIVATGLWNVPGASTATPAIIAGLYPALVGVYESAAISQVILVCVITSILTPVITQHQYKRHYGKLPEIKI